MLARNFIIIIVVTLFILTISYAWQENAPDDNGALAENSQVPVDPKTIEFYWTKERMDEAKPVPVPVTPTSSTYPRTPEAPQSIEQLKK